MTNKVTDLVLIPLRIALWDRDRDGRRVIPGELVHHNDTRQPVHLHPVHRTPCPGRHRPSIGTVADARDNGPMASVIGPYKTECIRTTIFHDGPYRTIADVEYATAGYVQWYDQRRLHGSLGMVPPVEFEQAHYAALTREPQPP